MPQYGPTRIWQIQEELAALGLQLELMDIQLWASRHPSELLGNGLSLWTSTWALQQELELIKLKYHMNFKAKPWASGHPTEPSGKSLSIWSLNLGQRLELLGINLITQGIAWALGKQPELTAICQRTFPTTFCKELTIGLMCWSSWATVWVYEWADGQRCAIFFKSAKLVF